MLIEAETTLIIGIPLAIAAGALSFLSPCVLPIFPAYMSYITGMSVSELQEEKNKKALKTLLGHSLVFLFGVSLVFLSLGAGASYLGKWMYGLLMGESGLLIQRISGVFIIVMGLFLAGWIQLPSLMKERRFQYAKKQVSFIGTFFIGLGFAAGWTPCIGPIFGSILLLAMNDSSQGILYTMMYIIGFALPFLILTFFIGRTRWIVKYSNVIMKIGAIIMILMGLVLFFEWMPVISGYLLDLVQDTWLSKLG